MWWTARKCRLDLSLRILLFEVELHTKLMDSVTFGMRKLRQLIEAIDEHQDISTSAGYEWCGSMTTIGSRTKWGSIFARVKGLRKWQCRWCNSWPSRKKKIVNSIGQNLNDQLVTYLSETNDRLHWWIHMVSIEMHHRCHRKGRLFTTESIDMAMHELLW